MRHYTWLVNVGHTFKPCKEHQKWPSHVHTTWAINGPMEFRHYGTFPYNREPWISLVSLGPKFGPPPNLKLIGLERDQNGTTRMEKPCSKLAISWSSPKARSQKLPIVILHVSWRVFRSHTTFWNFMSIVSIEVPILLYDFVVYMYLAKFYIKYLIERTRLGFMLYSWCSCFLT